MKNLNRNLLLIAGLVLSASLSQGQGFTDTFTGSSVNSSIWNVSLPFSQSTVVQSDGSLTTTGRGTLSTVSGFFAPYTVSGAVTLNNGFEHFGITLRSDLTATTASGLSEYDVLTGILVEFSADGNQVSIQQIDQGNPNPPILVEANYDFAVGQLYDFFITDTGNNVSLAIDGYNLISANTTFSTGDQIAFQSREFSDTSSTLNFLSIEPTPEPSSLALLGLGIGGFIAMRKKLKNF